MPQDMELAERARLEELLLRTRRPRTGIPLLPRKPGENTFPAEPVQARLWRAHHDHPDRAVVITTAGLRLRGPLDLTALSQALTLLGTRHEALRTVLRPDEHGEPHQVVLPRSALFVDVVEVTEAELDRVANSMVEAPLDPLHGPLLRLTLLRLSPQDHVVMLVIHHTFSDGRTLELVVEELCTAYEALCQGKPPPLPELALQYADVTGWLAQSLVQRRDRLRNYWAARLAGVRPLPLPTDRRRTGPAAPQGRTHLIPLRADLSARVAGLAAARRATRFTVLLAAFQLYLAIQTGRSDVVVVTPVTLRQRPELDSVVGALINYLPLRSEVSDDLSFAELVDRVRDGTLADFDHRDLPLDELLDQVTADPAMRQQLTGLYLMVEDRQPVPPPMGALVGTALPPPWRLTQRDLTVRVLFGTDDAELVVVHRLDVISEAWARRFGYGFRDLLDWLLDQPGLLVGSIRNGGSNEATAAPLPSRVD